MALNRVKTSRAAEKFVRQGRLDAALVEYQRLIDDSPDDLATLNKIGDLHCRTGQPQRALACFQRIADHYRDRGFAQKAIAMYKKIAKLDPENVDVLEQLVGLYQDHGLTREALKNLREAARLAAAAGENDRALELECRALELQPDDWQGQATLARRLCDAGQIERAVPTFLKAATGFAVQGDLDTAISTCHEALTAAPLDPEPAETLCRLLIEAGQADRAVQEFETLLDADPEAAHLAVLLGESLLENKDTTRARQVLDRARGTADAEGNVDYHVARLRLDLAEGKAADALTALPAVVPLLREAGRIGTALDLTCRALESGTPDKGILQLLLDLCREYPPGEGSLAGWKLLSRLLPGTDLEGEMEIVRRGMESARAGSGGGTPAGGAGADLVMSLPDHEPDPAESIADEEVDQDFVTEHLTEADVFIKYKLLPKAVAHLKRIVERYPSTAVAHQRLVELYAELGERGEAVYHCVALARAHQRRNAVDEARDALQSALRLDPDNTDLHAMRAALQKGQTLPPYRSRGQAEAHPPVEPAVAARQESPQVVAETSARREDATTAGGVPDTADAVPAAPVPGPPPVEEEVIDLLIDDAAAAPAAEVPASDVVPPPPAEPPVAATEAGGELAADTAPPESSDAGPVAEGDFYDLASALEEDLAREEEETLSVVDDSAEDDDPATGIRRAIQQQVGDEDHQTHYQLGIAFKEMGMLDEAIGEFQQASRDPDTFASCCSMLGLCFREKGMPQIAEKWYRRGLENVGADSSSEERLGLLYDLSELCLERGDLAQAEAGFTEVYSVNARYREVAARLRTMKDARGGPETAERTS